MANETLRVLIVEPDDVDGRLLQHTIEAEPDMQVVDVVPSGQEAVRRTAELRPDVVLMNVYLPDIDGFQATAQIMAQHPNCAVIMVTVESRTDFLQRAMLAGVQGYVLKPVHNTQLLADTVRAAQQRMAARTVSASEGVLEAPAPASRASYLARRIAFFTPKGGQGATSVAVNVALALRQLTHQEVVIFDADLQFGNAHILLDLTCEYSIVDLIPHLGSLDSMVLDRVVGEHASGVKLLMRPHRPEVADEITPEHIERMLTALSLLYDYVVVDCPSSYDDRLFAVLDRVDQIVLVLQPELGAVVNVERFLELTEKLGYPQRKMLVVLNRANTRVGLEIKDIQARLAGSACFRIDSVGAALTNSINLGQPLVLSQPQSHYAQAIREIAAAVRRGT